MIALKKCPRCGKYGVIYGHFHDSKDDKYGWLGVKCLKCGWRSVDKENTAIMIEEFKKLDDVLRMNETLVIRIDRRGDDIPFIGFIRFIKGEAVTIESLHASSYEEALNRAKTKALHSTGRKQKP